MTPDEDEVRRNVQALMRVCAIIGIWASLIVVGFLIGGSLLVIKFLQYVFTQ